MLVNQLADYIIKNLKKGYTTDSLRFSLINQGYTRITVENAIDLANKKMAGEIPEIKEHPEINYKAIADSSEKEKATDKNYEKKSFLNRLLSWLNESS